MECLNCKIVEGGFWQVLGWGTPWEGLSQKLGAALDAVAALPPDCVVLFTDAYDAPRPRPGLGLNDTARPCWLGNFWGVSLPLPEPRPPP